MSDDQMPPDPDLVPVAEIRTTSEGAARLLRSLAEGPPLDWAGGLCQVHCREDRCEIGCSCPGHQPDGSHVLQRRDPTALPDMRAAIMALSRGEEPVGECGHSALDAVDGCTDPIHPAPQDILEPLRREGQWEDRGDGPYAVLMMTGQGQAGCAWLVHGYETARTFAEFVNAEIDPALVLRLRDPALELLSWREAVAHPAERRLAAVRQLAERWQAGGPASAAPAAAAELFDVLGGEDPGPLTGLPYPGDEGLRPRPSDPQE